MSAESSQITKKLMPKTESLPLFIAFAFIMAVVLAVAFSALLSESDSELSRRILGTWEDRSVPDRPLKAEFRSDGSGKLGLSGGGEEEFTWRIDRGVLGVELKPSPTVSETMSVLFGPYLGIEGLVWLWSSGKSYEDRKSKGLTYNSVRFTSDSTLWLGKQQLKRLGVPPAQ